jgi:hypothetical protein
MTLEKGTGRRSRRNESMPIEVGSGGAPPAHVARQPALPFWPRDGRNNA